MELLGLGRSLIDHFRSQIITGVLQPGSRINENQLAKNLSISRGPIREALRVLETESLIVNIPRKGSFVTEISDKDMNELFMLREMIECFAIKIFKMQHIKNIAEINKIINDSLTLETPSKESSNEQKLKYLMGIGEFHFKLVKLTGNQQLFRFFMTIYSNINRYIFLNCFFGIPPTHNLEDHYEILDHIKYDRYNEAEKSVKKHLRSAKQNLEEVNKTNVELNGHGLVIPL